MNTSLRKVAVNEDGALLLSKVAVEVKLSKFDLDSKDGREKLNEHITKILSKSEKELIRALSKHLTEDERAEIKSKRNDANWRKARACMIRNFGDFLKKLSYKDMKKVAKKIKRQLGEEGDQSTLKQLLKNDNAVNDIFEHMKDVKFYGHWHQMRLLVDIVGRKILEEEEEASSSSSSSSSPSSSSSSSSSSSDDDDDDDSHRDEEEVDDDAPANDDAANVFEEPGETGGQPQAHNNANNDDAADNNINDDSFVGNNDNDMIPVDGHDDSFVGNNVEYHRHYNRESEEEEEEEDVDDSHRKEEEEEEVAEDQQSITTEQEFLEFWDVFESNEDLEEAAYELFEGNNMMNNGKKLREVFDLFIRAKGSDFSRETFVNHLITVKERKELELTFVNHLKIVKERRELERAVEDAEEDAQRAEKRAQRAEERAEERVQHAEERAQRAEERAQRAEERAEKRAAVAEDLAKVAEQGEKVARKKLALVEESAQDWEKTAQEWEKCGEGILRELRKEGPEFFATAHDQDLGNNSTHMTAEGLQLPVENLQLEQGSLASNAKAIDVIEQLVREASIRDAEVVRVKVYNKEARLGRFVGKDWLDGYEVCELKKERQALKERKKKLKQELDKLEEEAQRVVQAQPQQITFGGRTEVEPSGQHQASESESRLKWLLGEVERKDDELYYKWRALLSEKQAHIRASKRVKSEDSSKLRIGQKLENNENRYILVHILGKGGSSEVWRAYDLLGLKDVALKIQENESSWSEECKIHRDLIHKNVVPFFDSFQTQIDAEYAVFVIVLECCNGLSLAEKMENGRVVLPERDGLAILNQILSGTKYLSENGIIHYDLKPGNIVFDEKGNAKITDFGLSKISDADGMIINHGAGTFCYMAPECFSDDGNGRVSNKVDVWAIGVMFYQILFGKLPFGHGIMELAEFLERQTEFHAKDVKFPDEPTISKNAANPSKPAISDGAKAFIRYCLTRDQNDRPTMNQLCEHKYLTSSL